MEVLDRIKIAVKALISLGIGKNQEEIGLLLGYTSKSAFSQVLNNKVPLPSDFIERLCKLDKRLVKMWIVSEIGSVLRNKEQSKQVYIDSDLFKTDTKVIPMTPEPNYHLIPLYDGFVTASAISQDMPAQSEPVEMVNAGDWFRDATSAMRVHGDSMFPDYVSGSIVAMKEVFNKRLVVFGQDYLIETTEYRVLKRLQRSDLADNWLLCSTNEDIWEVGTMKGRLIHEPFDIHIKDVQKICLVLGSVKRNHSSRIVGL